MATPTNPFSEFLNPGNLTVDTATANLPIDQKFIVGIVSGGWTQKETLPASTQGFTGCGLYSILKLAQDTQQLANTPWYTSILLPNTTASLLTNDSAVYSLDQNFIYTSLNAFIGHLNSIHNNINGIIRQLLTPNGNPFSYNSGYKRTQQIDDYYAKGNTPNYAGKNAFLTATQYLFPNSYTGNTAGVLPFVQDPLYDANDNLINLGIEDLAGNGITGAFVTYDADDGIYRLSRTGIEFYTIANALAYNCIVMVGPNYINVTQSTNNYPQYPYLICDGIMSLDMGSYLDGQGITTGNNRAVYGALPSAYSSGNTYNFCHGSSAINLNNSFGQVLYRNNIFNSVTDSTNAVIDNIMVIHAGLSGADISLAQSSTSPTYADVYRYPGLDGRSSLYQYQLNTSGLTAYTLTADQLNYTFCILGKKSKIITTSSFGDANSQLFTEIPLVADVAGAFNRAVAQNKLYIGAAGYGEGKGILNADTVTPNINPTSDSATILKSRRINYYSSSPYGSYLASDYVGSTGPVANTNRVGVAWLLDQIDNFLTDYLNSETTGFKNRPNTQDTRNDVRNGVINQLKFNLPSNISSALDTTRSLNRDFDQGTNVSCDTSNNPNDQATTVQVDVTVYPISTAVYTGAGPSNIGAFTITVSAGG